MQGEKTMRNAAMLLAVILAASVATSADARKRVRHHHVAKTTVVKELPDARQRAAMGLFGLFLPSATHAVFANSAQSPYK